MNAPALGAHIGWTQLLDGNRREAALMMVDEIALALAELRPGEGPFSAILRDAPALAVLFAYLSRSRGSAQDGARAAQYVELAVEAAAAAPLIPSLDDGLAGVGWAAAQLQRILGLELGDLCAAIDEALLDHFVEVGWSGAYDLVRGVVGVGASALERLSSPSAYASLDWIIGYLERAAQPRAGGITWRTDPAWLPPEVRAGYPRGYDDVSVAHGVTGVAALLARAAAAGIRTERARSLCEAATRWVEALDVEYPCGLPYRIEPDATTRPPTRLAWCHGDLGVAAVRMATARAAGRPDWAESAHVLAHRAAARAHALSGVRDAGFCHGAAGVGHLFNRLYQATGADTLADAARFWFDQVLLLRRPARGIAGFAAFVAEADGSSRWVPKPGLIEGASGIALALLAAASPQEPWWDGILLLSNPERDAPS